MVIQYDLEQEKSSYIASFGLGVTLQYNSKGAVLRNGDMEVEKWKM